MGSKRRKIKTLEIQTLPEDFQIASEIIQEILSRLPVKSILQFRSVSKPWLSLISSDPSFPKLHFTCSLSGHRSALFVTAYDRFTDQLHFLSAAPRDSGGHVTHLMTLPKFSYLQCKSAETQHLNGLILFTTGNGYVNLNFAFVINPSTRSIYKLPPPSYVPNNSYQESQIFYFFGFDESMYEYKILNMRVLFKKDDPSKIVIEFMVFCLSDYSWRKIEVKGEIPITICGGIKRSVCVNSVIHMMLKSQFNILAFDLKTYKFEIFEIPRGAIPHELSTSYHENRLSMVKSNCPFLMKTNGLLALVCHDRVVERNEMDIWILQDYQNRVWVRETVAFSKSWIKLDSPFPLDFLSKDEIMFSSKTSPKKRSNIRVYDIKSGRFKSVKFILGDQFPNSNNLVFGEIRSYIESIMPLKSNVTGPVIQ